MSRRLKFDPVPEDSTRVTVVCTGNGEHKAAKVSLVIVDADGSVWFLGPDGPGEFEKEAYGTTLSWGLADESRGDPGRWWDHHETVRMRCRRCNRNLSYRKANGDPVLAKVAEAGVSSVELSALAATIVRSS